MEMGCVRLILQEAGGPDLIFFVEIQRVEQVFTFMVHCTNSCCNAANPVIYNLRAGARRASAQGSGPEKNMETAMNQQMDFEIPSSVRDIASRSVDQAREAYNRFLEAARQAQDVVSKSSDVFASGAREMNEKATKFAEANVQANFELALRLVHAKDLKEALDIQSQFARQQMETFAQQAQELSRLLAQSAQKAAPTGHF